MKDFLREKEIDGILNWALEGLKLWQKEGLEMPETMKLATTDYRCEMDIMQKFLDDCTKPKNNSSVGALDLYKEVNCVKALRTVDLRGRGRSYLYSKA